MAILTGDYPFICSQEFPKSWNWWLIQIVATAITVLLGEYLCSRRELEEIPMIDLFSKRARH